MSELDPMKRRLTWTVYATPLMVYYRLGPVHTCLYVRVRETGDWDLLLGPLEWARAETGGTDRWVLQRRGFPGVARVILLFFFNTFFLPKKKSKRCERKPPIISNLNS